MTTPSQPELPLVVAAARLARTAPPDWNQFVDAVVTYANQQAMACILSPVENLQVAQGRAQMAHRIAALLQGCVSMADKLER